MKYYLIAGEASGDLHASNLIKALKKQDPDAHIRGFGGDLMKEAGAEIFIHYRDMAMMGLVEVVQKYPVIRKRRKECRQDILNYKPDLLILVDYSGFNLPMARFVAEKGIRVIYYISPKLWAWAKWRVKTVKAYVDKMFVILPFEVDFYKQHNVTAEYYGNPVLDSITHFEKSYDPCDSFRLSNNLGDGPIVALLAGSRKQEIKDLLPEMLQAIRHFPGFQFIIAGAPSISPEFYKTIIGSESVRIVYNQTYRLLKESYAAVVTSGTATLETALLNVPQIVVYKTNPVTFFIGNFLVKIRFFSLVNLILGREAVKELLQNNLSEDIRTELQKIVNDKVYYRKMQDDYAEIRQILGQAGVADRVAYRIYELIGA